MSSIPDLNLRVASLSTATRIKRNFDAVITIEDPGFRNGLRFHNTPHPDHLVMLFEDVDTYEMTVALPAIHHVEASLSFAREHADGSLLVHCKAGVARSTAVALAIIADRLGEGNEAAAVDHLLKIRPEAAPNLVLLDIVDDCLGRGGKLKQAWTAVENGDVRYQRHRQLKQETLTKFPGLYRGPFACLSYSAWRYRPDSMTREKVIAPAAPLHRP